MSTQDDIDSALQQIAELESVVLLLNDYRGMPVSHEAVIRRFAAGTATVNVHPHQAVCLALDGHTVLQSRLLSLALRARVAALDPASRVAELSAWAPTTYITEGRRALRVWPHAAASSAVLIEEQRLMGSLVNVSASGLRIQIPLDQIRFDLSAVFQRGAEVRLFAHLPPEPAARELVGRLAYVTLHPNVISLGINLGADTRAPRILAAFIELQRQAVLPELDEVYEQLVATGSRKR